MTEKLVVRYDKDADFFEIRLANGSDKTSFEEIGDTEVFNEIDENTSKKVGIAIFGFSKRFAKPHELQIKLPFELA